MTNDAILIQQAYKDSESNILLDYTKPMHTRYCKKHDFDYEVVRGNVVEEWMPVSNGSWAKVELLRRNLGKDYKYVVWLDADSLIVDTKVDLRDACKGIGAVWVKGVGGHFNAGALYCENTKNVRTFMDMWAKFYPGEFPWREQSIFNQLARVPDFRMALIPIKLPDKLPQDVVHAIDNRYNSYDIEQPHPDNPYVEAWHHRGTAAEKLIRMQEYYETKVKKNTK